MSLGQSRRLAGRVKIGGTIRTGRGRLCSFPSPDRERPVLILTPGSAIPYLSRVTVAPITSTMRGVPSEVPLGTEDGARQACAVNLHSLVTIRQGDPRPAPDATELTPHE